MKNLIKTAIVMVAAVSVSIGVFTVQSVSAENSWKPDKPINLVVPWGGWRSDRWSLEADSNGS